MSNSHDNHSNDEKYWKDAVTNFQYVFGAANLCTTDAAIEILIDLSAERRFDQFQLLGAKLNEEKIHFFTSAGDNKLATSKDELGIIKFSIPYFDNVGFEVKGASAFMWQDADVRLNKNKRGETIRRIMPHEPEYVLQDITGIAWDKVEGSPYRLTILEPALQSPANGRVRRKQEFGLGFSLLHENQARIEITDWLEAQATIETKEGLEPRTAIPTTWATETRLARAQGADTMLRGSLKSAFQK